MNIPIVYEDEWLLVADKPSGLLVIPAPNKEARTLTAILNADLKEKEAAYRAHPCHRLDRDTSGLIIFAKGKAVQRKMMEQFKQREVKKTYIAFVRGIPSRVEGEIKIPVEGMPAVTQYKVVEKRINFAIVEVNPLTGRTNQIRIHFKQLGHPILGERRFAFRRDFTLKAKRLCLHARDLEFTHPVRKSLLILHAELPKDLKAFLETNN